MKEKVYLAVDIETGGHGLEHSLLAIGVCVGNDNGQVLEKKTWCLEPRSGESMDEHCFNEFWSKNLDVLNRIKKENLPYDSQMSSFIIYLEGLEVLYPEDQYSIIILSDNPSFDIGILDYRLHLEGRKPLRYSSSGNYRRVLDPSQQLDATSLSSIAKPIAEKIVSHDHWPENDAENIFQLYTICKKVKNQIIQNMSRSHIINSLTNEETKIK